MSDYHGHITRSDGTHVPLTADQANDLFQRAKDAQRERAEKLPDSLSCLSAISEAKHRLRELGWSEGAFCPRDGSTFAVAEIGSTGMWAGTWMGVGGLLSHGVISTADSGMTPEATFWKAIDKLTNEERERMRKCDADNAAWAERLAKSLSFED